MSQFLSWERAQSKSITLVEGVRVGHWTDTNNATGCTAIVCETDAVTGVDVRGGATASREIELLNPTGLVEHTQGIVLSGGSAMGLASAEGAIRFMRQSERGFKTEQGRVPVVPAAALFDLGIGSSQVFPDSGAGFEACSVASTQFARGSVGVGTGAVVGKIHGHAHAMKGGVGSAGWETSDGLRVGAIAAVNAFGDVIDFRTGHIVAGARTKENQPLDSSRELIEGGHKPIWPGGNTTLCVVATNAKLSRTQATVVSRIAQAGLSRVVSPCHTQYDGDMAFTLSMGDREFDLNRIGVVAAWVVQAAILDAAFKASALDGIPSATDIGWTVQPSMRT